MTDYIFVFFFMITLMLTVAYVFMNENYSNYNRKTFVNEIKQDTMLNDHKSLFKLAHIYHHGLFGNTQNIQKAVMYYNESIKNSSDNTHIGLVNLQLGKLYSSNNLALQAIDKYLVALKFGYIESILCIGKIYLYGLPPNFLPNKMYAAKIFNTFLHSHPSITNWCKLYIQEINELDYSDLDSIPIHNVQHLNLPFHTIENIHASLNNIQSIVIPFQNQFDLSILKINQPDDDDLDILNDEINLPIQYIHNDSQNVHDHILQNQVKNNLNSLTNSKDSFQSNVNNLFSKLSEDQKNPVERVCSSLSSSIHSKYNKSEQEVFNSVWTYINSHQNKENLIPMFIDNIISCIEDDVIVCSTGKIVRMMSTMDILDENTTNLKSEWMIKEELANLTIHSIKYVLNTASSKEQDAYNEIDPNNTQVQLSNNIKEKIKNRIKQIAKNDYVNTNIMSQETLNLYMNDYLDNI